MKLSNGSLAIYQTDDSVLSSVGLHQNGRRYMLVYHRDQFWAHSYFSYSLMILSKTFTLLFDYSLTTCLYIIIENPQTAALIMNSDLGTISTWALNWLVDFHPCKTVSFLVSDTNPYNLRTSDNIQPFRTRTNIFFNSFFPSTIRAWNNLSEEIRNSNTVNSFKNNLHRSRLIPPKFFNAGSRIGQILHARLRMECSTLNAHLYGKNIVPSPSCTCGAFESPYHYFFHCPRYVNIRETYLHSYLESHNTHELLYGKEPVSAQENEALFLSVQEFIVKSKRFA